MRKLSWLFRLHVKKWLVCSWKHRGHRCHPCCGHDDYQPNHWHCMLCTPCGEELEIWFPGMVSDAKAQKNRS